MESVILDLGKGKRSDISELIEGEGKYIEKINKAVAGLQEHGIAGEVRVITVVVKTPKRGLL